MKKFFLTILFLGGLIFVILPKGVSAAADYGYESAQGKLPGAVAGASDPYALIGGVIEIALGLVGIVFFILILYAGIRWMTAMGRNEEVEKAKNMMQAAIIGLAIIGAAYAITYFIFNELQKMTEYPEVSCIDIRVKEDCQLPLCKWDGPSGVCETASSL